ncbi:MAG: hypothetical protein C0507_14500 [Cyanobacteria bacterium PR.3.49]|nr:hypothetical protein [Cyanobacteria bacterium PR.3.49]
MSMTKKAEESQNEEQVKSDRPIPTAWGYRGFVLVSAAFIIFELIFISLYSTTSWFSTDIRYLGIPVVLVLLPVAHQVLLSFERKPLLWAASPVRNGLPLILYWNWLTLGESALFVGLRKVAYSSIDELKLTIWGNLHIRTRSIRQGSEVFAADAAAQAAEPTDLIFKLPLGVVSPQFQRQLVETIKQANPDLVTNQRLVKKLAQQDISASQMIGVMGAAIMFMVLLDLGQSSYTYLDVLKNYYNADLSARKNETAESQKYFDQAEKLMREALPMSWIKTKFFEEGNGASGVKIARAEALWHMGKHQEAIEACREALKLSPKAFRINLRLARWLNATNAPADARKEIEQAMDIKKDSFLPRGYMVALEDERSGSTQAQKRYETYLKELDEELFAEEPVWPPGGERFLHDIWYREDLTFVFDRLLKLVRRS